MEEVIVKEILKSCSLKERILAKLFSQVFINAYKKGVKDGFNWANRTVR